MDNKLTIANYLGKEFAREEEREKSDTDLMIISESIIQSISGMWLSMQYNKERYKQIFE